MGNFSQSRTKKNCYGSGVKNFAYYAVFLPSFALDRRRRDCDGGRQRERETRGEAKAHKPQVVVTIKGESRNLS